MSKQVSNGELAEIVTGLLVGRLTNDHLDSTEQYASFMTDIAKVVCDHCGGEVVSSADNSFEQWLVGIECNESSPHDGGIWKFFDSQSN